MKKINIKLLTEPKKEEKKVEPPKPTPPKKEEKKPEVNF